MRNVQSQDLKKSLIDHVKRVHSRDSGEKTDQSCEKGVFPGIRRRLALDCRDQGRVVIVSDMMSADEAFVFVCIRLIRDWLWQPGIKPVLRCWGHSSTEDLYKRLGVKPFSRKIGLSGNSALTTYGRFWA